MKARIKVFLKRFKSFNSIPNLWLTAYNKHKIYPAKFRLPIDLKIEIDDAEVPQSRMKKNKITELSLAKYLDPLTILIKGKKTGIQEVIVYFVDE